MKTKTFYSECFLVVRKQTVFTLRVLDVLLIVVNGGMALFHNNFAICVPRITHIAICKRGQRTWQMGDAINGLEGRIA